MATASRPRDKEDLETPLEYLIDTISSVPNELKRNLEHIASLDAKADAVGKRLQALEYEFLETARRKIREFPLPQVDPSEHCTAIPIPTTEELKGVIDDPESLGEINSARALLRQLNEERVLVAEQTFLFIDEHGKRVEKELAEFEETLKETGFFDNTGARPGELVAINLGSNSLSGSVDWILGKVLSYDASSSTYHIADEDAESATKTYSLPERQVMRLGNFDKLSKGDRVYAVYPDTTSFYQATVCGVRKMQGGAGPSMVYVNFLDDHDEVGYTHDKAVMMAHVMKM